MATLCLPRSTPGPVACLLALSSLYVAAPPVAAQSCDLIQELTFRNAVLISYDGRVVIESTFTGAYRSVDGEDSIEFQSLGFVEALNDISRDGEFVVGSSTIQLNGLEHACRWDADGILQDLGTLGGHTAVATACSDDGSVVVGLATDSSATLRAFRWDELSGMQALPIAGSEVGAVDISADGTVIVGTSSVGSYPNVVREMWRWTQAGGVQFLGGFQGNNTVTHGISADGSAIVGSAIDGFSRNLIRWTAAGGFEEIHGFSSAGLDFAGVSSDGSTVGYSWIDYTTESYMWREGFGRHQVSSMGDDFLRSISADGTVGVGQSVIFAPTVRFATIWDLETIVPNFPSETIEIPGVSSIGFIVVSGDGSVAGGSFTTPTQPQMSRAIVVPVPFSIAERYCAPAIANSTGCGASVSAHGSGSASIADLRLSAGSLPPGVTGYFLASMLPASTFPVPGSQGRLCLGGAIGRIVGPNQVFSASAAGRASVLVTSGTLPSPSGAMAVAAGDTWNFQAWYRDANPGATSNFSDAVAVTFH